MHRLEGLAGGRALPILPALEGLLELRTGTVCGVSETALAMALLAGPSRAGEWAAVVGMPDFGLEAAAQVGIDLTRTIVVPDPGEHWLSVTAGLVDVASVVLVQPPGPVTEHQAIRLAARLRQRDAALLALGAWPRCVVRLTAREPVWLGLGQGHGHLRGRVLRVRVTTNAAPPREASLLLPGPGQEIVRVDGDDRVEAPIVAWAG